MLPTTTHTNTTANARDKLFWPTLVRAAFMGIIIRMIGTAPRSPSQETASDSRMGNRNNSNSGVTTSGRAINAKIKAISVPLAITRTSSSDSGITKTPSTKNITICARYASDAWKRTMVLRNGKSALFPRVSAVMNTASNPLECNDSAMPYANSASAMVMTG